MEVGGVWSRIARERQVSTVRIGSLVCIPMLEGRTVTGWVVPFAGEPTRMVASACLGGAPVWMVAADADLDEMTPFEASYWGVGLGSLSVADTVNIVCRPQTVRPAGARERGAIAARGWSFADEG